MKFRVGDEVTILWGEEYPETSPWYRRKGIITTIFHDRGKLTVYVVDVIQPILGYNSGGFEARYLRPDPFIQAVREARKELSQKKRKPTP